jgi:adenosylhomocysteine nucleosidase
MSSPALAGAPRPGGTRRSSRPEVGSAGFDDGLTAVVSALPRELAPLIGRTANRRKSRAGGRRVVRGTLGRADVVLMPTGDGRQAASEGLSALLAAFPVRRLIVVGIAGGLSPALDPGTILVAGEVRSAGAAVPAPDATWVERALASPLTREAVLLSSETILCSPESKAKAWRELGRQRPAAVDLESAAYAAVAARNGIPYVVLRAICDPAEEPLPFDLNRCRDRRGRVSQRKVVARAMLHPGDIAALWSLRRRVAVCSIKLARLVNEILNGGSR